MTYPGLMCLLMMCSVSAAAQTAPARGTGVLSEARVFSAGQGPTQATGNGRQSRNILHETLATGEAVSIHESIQPAGSLPNPPHAIQHSEFILVLEGTLAFEHDGVSEQAGPGSIIYVAFGTMHTVRNVGDTAARYTVIAVGGDQKQ